MATVALTEENIDEVIKDLKTALSDADLRIFFYYHVESLSCDTLIMECQEYDEDEQYHVSCCSGTLVNVLSDTDEGTPFIEIQSSGNNGADIDIHQINIGDKISFNGDEQVVIAYKGLCEENATIIYTDRRRE